MLPWPIVLLIGSVIFLGARTRKQSEPNGSAPVSTAKEEDGTDVREKLREVDAKLDALVAGAKARRKKRGQQRQGTSGRSGSGSSETDGGSREAESEQRAKEVKDNEEVTT